MRVRFFIFGSVVSVAVLFFFILAAPVVVAQTEGVSSVPAEVILDETITAKDLDATEARILPDSPWHVFKRLGWQIQEAFTVDTVKDAELKHDHAMQELWEVKQLVDEKGVSAVDADVIAAAIERSEGRLSDVSSAAADLSKEREEDPEAVAALMDNFADKHIKEQKILDTLQETVITAAAFVAEGEGETVSKETEQLVTVINENKSKMTENFVNVLGMVDPTPEAASERLTQALKKQTGSDLRDLRHLVILTSMSDVAPDNIKEAVALAKKNTVEQFEMRVKNLPPIVRAEQLKRYVEFSPGDDIRLFTLLEDIKNTSNVPSDVLEKLEEAKELVSKKFERKFEQIQDPVVKASLIEHRDLSDAGQVIALEDFRNRLTQGSVVAKDLADAHEKAVTAFKARFTDATSQNQAELFTALSRKMIENPTPKTFALLRELEQEVQGDPEKSGFLESLENQMTGEVEARYRREGERFAERYASLDPQDIASIEAIEISPEVKSAIVKQKIDKLATYVRDAERPEEFDRVYERFVSAPQVAIDSIKAYDPEFQNALQFKWRKIEQQRLEEERSRQIARSQIDYEERELRHQTDRVERQENDEFFRKLNETKWDNFDTRKQLWEEKIQDSYARLNERYAEQKRLFEARLSLDPFGCDKTCQSIQTQFLDQELRHQREVMGDDLERERKNIELEKARYELDNPLAARCNTSESCETYCRKNQKVPECQWITVALQPVACAPGFFWDAGQARCVSTTETSVQQSCAVGTYWDGKNCLTDPFFKPPERFIACGTGFYWDGGQGICRKTNETENCKPTIGSNGTISYPQDCTTNVAQVCSSGFFWDSGKRDCVPTNIASCEEGFYYDYLLRRCEKDNRRGCGHGQFWDEGSRSCASFDTRICPITSYLSCPNGEYRETKQKVDGCWVPGGCIPIEKNRCPAKPVDCQVGLFRSESVDQNGCTIYSECQSPICPAVMPRICAPGEAPLPPDKRKNPCADWSCVLPPEPKPIACPTRPSPCPSAMHRDITIDQQGCSIYGSCVPDEQPITPICGNNICDSSETAESCPSDCDTVALVCNSNGVCESNETYDSCRSDCGGTTACDNDGSCEYGESSGSCPSDCGSTTVCNGDGVCGGSETSTICPSECPATPWCGDGACNGRETTESCLQDCAPGEDPLCNGSPYYCRTKTGCIGRGSYWCGNSCSASACKDGGAFCGNAVCDPGETSTKCPYDCTGTITSFCTATPSACTTQVDCTSHGFYWCNGACQSAACSGTTCNKNGTCDSNETIASCPSDCSSDTTTYCGGSGWHYDLEARSCVRDGVVCSAPKACDACRTSSATKWCQWTGDGCPVSCQTTVGGYCGNNICDSGETVTSCVTDCAPKCDNDGICDSGETGTGCPNDCSSSSCSAMPVKCTSRSTCEAHNFTWCDSTSACYSNSSSAPCASSGGGGTSSSCGPDWTWNSTTNSCVKNSVTCSNPNACSACPAPGSTTQWCTYDNNGCPSGCASSGSTTANCNNNRVCDSNESTTSCPSDCAGSGNTACNGNGTCDYGESTGSCPSDCGSSGCNYNNVCDSNESYSACPSDCGGGSSSCNNNGACESNESYSSCPSDCGGSGSWTACNGNGTCDYGESTGSCPSDCHSSSSAPTGNRLKQLFKFFALIL